MQGQREAQEFYKKLFDWKIEALGPAAMIAAEAGGITGPGGNSLINAFHSQGRSVASRDCR